jgi:hypothetical protein
MVERLFAFHFLEDDEECQYVEVFVVVVFALENWVFGQKEADLGEGYAFNTDD